MSKLSGDNVDIDRWTMSILSGDKMDIDGWTMSVLSGDNMDTNGVDKIMSLRPQLTYC